MEQLFTPHIGLMIWTILTFLILVFILGRWGWKPLIEAIEEREAKIKADLEATKSARESAEKMRAELEEKMAELSQKTREMLSQAKSDGEKAREELLKKSAEEAKQILEKTKRQLDEERDRLVRELRAEVAGLSIQAAERILRQVVDRKSQERLVQDFLKDLERAS